MNVWSTSGQLFLQPAAPVEMNMGLSNNKHGTCKVVFSNPRQEKEQRAWINKWNETEKKYKSCDTKKKGGTV